MIFGLFGLGDRRRAKKLVKLADQTIEIMERFLSHMPDGPDRNW